MSDCQSKSEWPPYGLAILYPSDPSEHNQLNSQYPRQPVACQDIQAIRQT